MSNINEMLSKLEGFKYTESLGLKLGYYQTWLSENASNLCSIMGNNVSNSP